MIWTADCIVHEGLALPEMGLDIAANGRIRALAPLSMLPAPDQVLRGRAILAGRIDTYHHSLGILARRLGNRFAAAPCTDAANTDSAVFDPSWTDRLSPRDLYTVACAAFIRLLTCGFTCVGEVHSLRYQADGTPYANPLCMAEAVFAAARDTGIRLAMIDNVRLRQTDKSAAQQPLSQSAPHLETACSDFEALVGALVNRCDPSLSWALGAHSLQAVPYDALVGLRVRLGHMPFLMPLPGSSTSQAMNALPLGAGPIQTLARQHVLDACVTVVATQAMQGPDMAALAEVGSNLCLCLTPTGELSQTPAALARQTRPFLIPCIASGSADPASLAQAYTDWPRADADRNLTSVRPMPTVAHLADDMNHVAAKALGIDTGRLTPGRWGDFISVALPVTLQNNGAAPGPSPRPRQSPDGATVAASERHAEHIWRHMLDGAFYSVVRDVVVAGVPVVRDGVHALAAASQANFEVLAQQIFTSI